MAPLHELLDWLTENWEPLLVFGGIVAGVAMGTAVGLWVVSRGPYSKMNRETASALKEGTEALRASQATQREQAEALNRAYRREEEQHGKLLALQDQVEVLEDAQQSERARADAERAALAAEVAGLATQLQAEREMSARLIREVDGLRQRIGTLERENAALRRERDELTGQRDTLQKRVDALEQEREDLRARLDGLDEEVARLKRRDVDDCAGEEAAAEAETKEE